MAVEFWHTEDGVILSPLVPADGWALWHDGGHGKGTSTVCLFYFTTGIAFEIWCLRWHCLLLSFDNRYCVHIHSLDF